MHFTRQSQFSPGAVYMVIIMKDGDHNRSIGFFHHKKRETGFLTYAGFLSEVRTVEVKRRLTKDFVVIDFVKLADFPYSKGFSVYCDQVGSVVIQTDYWLRDVLLRLDGQRILGKLMWRHKGNETSVISGLRTFFPMTFVLLSALSFLPSPLQSS